MKLLVKAYGKKNIAELTPKKVLVTSSGKKPYWMTTYIATNKDKENSGNIPSNKNLLEGAKEGDFEKVLHALESGANVNAKDSNGETALMHASRKGRVDIVRHLLKNGADVNIPNNDGWTALMYASKYGHHDVFRTLRNYGAKTVYIPRETQIE